MPTTTALGAWYSSFNPHPARRPDAIRRGLARSVQLRFQSSSGQKAGCNTITRRPTLRSKPFQSSSGLLAGCNGLVVSYAPNSRMGFNPHPARRPDATCSGRCWLGFVLGFNPHPAFWPDATLGQSLRQHRQSRFNPHPARRPDATCVWRALAQSKPCFNPHPARRPDATGRSVWAVKSLKFQSSSGQKAGCNPFLTVTLTATVPVSILIRPSGRMQP